MTNDYLCPICKSHVNIGNAVVISAKSPENEKGLIFLDAELGNYNKTTHPEFKLQQGVKYTFYCPVCHAKLNTQENPNLVKLLMIDESGKESEIIFSNIIGEQCTFKIKDKKAEAFGPDADKYRKYVDLPTEYRKYL